MISEYKALEIAPGSPCLNYGIQCFEGMKAYKDANGHIRMFRPDMNMKRMNYSMQRLAMPTLDQDGLLECIKALVRTDGDWIPQDPGCSLYIRPLAIGTSAWLGVAGEYYFQQLIGFDPSLNHFSSPTFSALTSGRGC